MLSKMISDINARLGVATKLNKKIMENQQEQEDNVATQENSPMRAEAFKNFSTPDEYKTLTGKRFRHRKEEKAAGLTRQEAFESRIEELYCNYCNDNPKPT